MRVVVRFAPSDLRTGHAGLDLEASALRYRDALRAALVKALPDHEVEVQIDAARAGGAPAGMVVTCDEEGTALARAIEREVLDHAWVVRQMADWAVVA